MSEHAYDRERALNLLQVSVVVPTLVFLGVGISRDPDVITLELAGLAALVAVVELLPVPAWRGLQLSVGLPLLLMIGMIHPPLAAGVAALLGASDPREFKGQVSILQAMFNRCQIALSAMAASWAFHAVANL